jgi:hypothetical protein
MGAGFLRAHGRRRPRHVGVLEAKAKRGGSDRLGWGHGDHAEVDHYPRGALVAPAPTRTAVASRPRGRPAVGSLGQPVPERSARCLGEASRCPRPRCRGPLCAVRWEGASYALTLPRDSVGSKQLRARAVTSTKLGTGAVTARALRDGGVSGRKIASGSVLASDLGGGSVRTRGAGQRGGDRSQARAGFRHGRAAQPPRRVRPGVFRGAARQPARISSDRRHVPARPTSRGLRRRLGHRELSRRGRLRRRGRQPDAAHRGDGQPERVGGIWHRRTSSDRPAPHGRRDLHRDVTTVR